MGCEMHGWLFAGEKISLTVNTQEYAQSILMRAVFSGIYDISFLVSPQNSREKWPQDQEPWRRSSRVSINLIPMKSQSTRVLGSFCERSSPINNIAS
jgi:hypothetical protein